MSNERIQRLHKFMRDFKRFMRDNHYDIDEKDIQGYLRGLVHFNVNELKERIMDYKKKYKEALSGIQELYNSMKYMSSTDALHTTMYLEKAFPELKESEDEKIRKEILEYFQQFENEELRGVNISDWIAWLEKQGDIDRRIQEEIEKQTKQQWNAEKQGEQNPAWSEEDERMCNISIRGCKCVIDNFENSTWDYEDAIVWLKSLKDRVQPQWKPSEEQLNALDEVYKTHGANGVCRRIIFKLLEQLKKL